MKKSKITWGAFDGTGALDEEPSSFTCSQCGAARDAVLLVCVAKCHETKHTKPTIEGGAHGS